ncbi:hypothetical protein [Burkholderia vietnamiensis]|uniref:hypothetical protein n=1 Tax=Burkholderia vietnamiensis TaxID=60552 RepID=UPI00159313BC|nr:hypothetical protein [Burkholderia vietnamiensis]
MPDVIVVLPEGDLIEWRASARAISEAVHPMIEVGAIGMQCIIGKRAWAVLPDDVPVPSMLSNAFEI